MDINRYSSLAFMTWIDIRISFHDVNPYSSLHLWYKTISKFTSVIWIHILIRMCDIHLYSSLHSWYKLIFECSFVIWVRIEVRICDMNLFSSLHSWYESILKFAFYYKSIFEYRSKYESGILFDRFTDYAHVWWLTWDCH